MENFNIQDLPDNWFDVIHNEGNLFLLRISEYPLELGLMVVQVIMQTIVYNAFKRDVREAFLIKMLDAFLEQFEAWEEEDNQEESESSEES